ncbi:hypothetical protein PpBr36_02690 [Pyricularia pennisetigena]|uniref:hypothetical protein n=1 Tax=Pyricularia pennisetigena TaxID=1578925 RepID=UPI0011540875|nr:hypothetical protein PpBr36_02690 [Pyricularia pennisetigena]TLS30471.1 hypothetical protein PpBr36_02690 [Pyricularia pennisetigena]
MAMLKAMLAEAGLHEADDQTDSGADFFSRVCPHRLSQPPKMNEFDAVHPPADMGQLADGDEQRALIEGWRAEDGWELRRPFS